MQRYRIAENPCPRCNSELQFTIEVERKSKSGNISYIYMCPVCRYKRLHEQLELKLDGDKILITRSTSRYNSNRKLF